MSYTVETSTPPNTPTPIGPVQSHRQSRTIYQHRRHSGGQSSDRSTGGTRCLLANEADPRIIQRDAGICWIGSPPCAASQRLPEGYAGLRGDESGLHRKAGAASSGPDGDWRQRTAQTWCPAHDESDGCHERIERRKKRPESFTNSGLLRFTSHTSRTSLQKIIQRLLADAILVPICLALICPPVIIAITSASAHLQVGSRFSRRHDLRSRAATGRGHGSRLLRGRLLRRLLHRLREGTGHHLAHAQASA